MEPVKIYKTTTPKQKPQDESTLGFGKHFTDHMLTIDYTPQTGWNNARISPYAPIMIDPANSSLHYGQLIFDGLKAYYNVHGKVVMFRPADNMARFNRSGARFCIPSMDVDATVEAMAQLISIDKDWIPKAKDTSLYIRPFAISADNYLGVHPAEDYTFMTILSPVGTYYKEGLSPIKIYVEQEYVRAAARGGTGDAKCAGNYAASLLAQHNAEKLGYAQVLWLDSNEHRYVEEIGTTNAFFVIDGEVITPELNGSILPGITRDSAIQLLRHWGITVTERRISMDEIVQAHRNGTLQEAFATGTAAVVSPIGAMRYQDDELVINGGNTGAIAQRLYTGITDIQHGRAEDIFHWVYPVD